MPAANSLGSYGRWAFAEFIDVWETESDFATKVERRFQEMFEGVVQGAKP